MLQIIQRTKWLQMMSMGEMHTSTDKMHLIGRIVTLKVHLAMRRIYSAHGNATRGNRMTVLVVES